MSEALIRTTGRGALVNLGFAVVVQGLVAVQALVVPRLIGPEAIGLFALAVGGVSVGNTLKELGIPQKLVQEREVDLHTSYRVAFTLELVLAGAFLVVVLLIAPILAVLYDRPELGVLTAVLGFSIFSVAFLDLPAAIPYREMRFVRYNALVAIGPVVGFAVTVPLAFLGWGEWSLAAGSLAGFVAASVILLVAGPIRPGLMWDRAVVRRYISFGGPIWVGQLLSVAAGWGAVLAVSSVLGVAGLGYFQLAQSWAARALQIDGILSNTVFPALCSVQSSLDRLRRAFILTNRLSMLWAASVGLGIALFAEPVVLLLLGPTWEPAILLVQAQGAGVVVTSIGYNWHLFFAARGETRPQMVVSLLGVAWLVLAAIPLLLAFGLGGAAASIIVLAAGTYIVRQYYLRTIFGPFSLVGLVWRELVAGAACAATVLVVREVWWEVHDILGLVAQMAFYGLLVAAAGLLATGPVIRHVLSAVRTARTPEDAGHVAADVGEAAGLRSWGTPRPLAFPLMVSYDASEAALWVTTRDWPALGRLDVTSGEWRWTELGVFPHAANPDGAGGCWTALTRSSAVAHVDAAGATRVIEVPRSKELLVSALAGGVLWVVDADNRQLFGVATDGGELREIRLPGVARPDFVVADADGFLWVADTSSPVVVLVDPSTSHTTEIEVPHPTRFAVADPGGRGLWLGASDRGRLTLVDRSGSCLAGLELPAVPFGVAADATGSTLAIALRDLDVLVLVDASADPPVAAGRVTLPQGSAPMGIAHGGGRWWATCAHSSRIMSVPAEAFVAEVAGP